MKKIIAAAMVALILVSGLVVSCAGVKLQGSGNLINETFDISDFTGIKVENGIQVELSKSSTFSVEVTADDNVIEYIEVNKSGDKLRIKPKANARFRSATLTAKVTMPELYNLELSGGSHADVTGFSSSHDLSVKLSGGSHVNKSMSPGNIAVGDAYFDLSGGSHVTFSGSADNLIVNKGSDGSHLNLEGFSVSNADVKLTNGSQATINVDGTLNVNLSGGSEVFYVGEPTMGDIEVDWESDITKK